MLSYILQKVNGFKRKKSGGFYMNIYDIAKKAGVSIATVSRVINNSGYVGKETKKRVLAAIEQANYAPSKIAQNLSTSSTMKLIGIVCYNIDDLYYAKAVSVLERELSKYGYDIILSCTGESREQRQRSVDMLIEKSADAVIFIGSVFAGATEQVILSAAKFLPVFIINALVKGKNIYCAYCDEGEAVQECVQELYQKGRKNLLFIYDTDTYGSSIKLKGFLSAAEKLKLKHSVLKCGPGIHSAREAFKDFMSNDSADAVICANDVTAAGVMNAAESLNIDIPGTLSLIGYNNSLIARCMQMTSLKNNVEKLSEFTAANLNNYFIQGKAEKVYKTDFEIINRKTL